MAQSAKHADHDPAPISIVAVLRIACQGDSPTDDPLGADQPKSMFLRLLTRRLNPAPRRRAAPRVSKGKRPRPNPT
jgi:hypothetical protein